jgi:hypothetical protein
MKLVLLPGWHESGDDMKVFVKGRHGIAGFEGMGYDCVIFPQGQDPLRARIDRFAAFLADLKVREPQSFPVVTFGYSAGGLVNRGFLRAYPERAHDIFATIQVATPNAGLISEYIAVFLRLMRMPNEVIDDIDVESPFMTWINGTTGHWNPTTRKDKKKVWRLNTAPIVVPDGSRIYHIAGTMPKYEHDSDGLVMKDWATLEGHVPGDFIDDPMANHLNLGAVFNVVGFLFRGFRRTDDIWKRVVTLTDRYITQESGYASKPAAETR